MPVACGHSPPPTGASAPRVVPLLCGVSLAAATPAVCFRFCRACFGVISKKQSPRPRPRRLSSGFSSSPTVVGPVCQPVVRSDPIPIAAVREGSESSLPHGVQRCHHRSLSVPSSACVLGAPINHRLVDHKRASLVPGSLLSVICLHVSFYAGATLL